MYIFRIHLGSSIRVLSCDHNVCLAMYSLRWPACRALVGTNFHGSARVGVGKEVIGHTIGKEMSGHIQLPGTIRGSIAGKVGIGLGMSGHAQTLGIAVVKNGVGKIMVLRVVVGRHKTESVNGTFGVLKAKNEQAWPPWM